jgi:hypothetical protein
LQAEIEKRNGAKPIIEFVFDPDGRNITLEGKHDLKQISDIELGHDIFPGEETEYRVSDLTAYFNDPDNFFSLTKSGGLFRDIRGYLMEDAAISATALKLTKGGMTFEAGDSIVLCSVGNEETKVVQSVDYSTYPSYDLLTLTAGLTYAHVAGVYVYTKPITGTKISIILRFDGCADTITLYTGYIESSHDRETGVGILKIKDASDLELRKPILTRIPDGLDDGYYDHGWWPSFIIYQPTNAMPYRGGYVYIDYSSIISRIDIGYDNKGLMSYDGCPLGPYVFEFEDDTNFSVTGADCFKKTGSTASIFYSKTDETDSLIRFSPSAWDTLTPDSGDWVKAYVSVFYLAKTVPQILYDLLYYYGRIDRSKIDASEFFGGGNRLYPLPIPLFHNHMTWQDDEPIDLDSDYSFDVAFKEMEYERISICFYKPTSVMEAIQIVSKHGQCVVYQDKNGIWKIKTSAPKQLTASIGTISDTTNLIDIAIEDTEPINEITIFYCFEYREIDPTSEDGSLYSLQLSEKYKASYTYPETDNSNQSFLRTDKKTNAEINCPGIYVEDLAKSIARRYYQMWKDGRRIYTVTMNLQGINLEIGDKVTLTCACPDINTDIEIFNIKLSTLNKYQVIVQGFDLNIMPDKYAYLDDTTKRRGYSDEGYKVW